jgi:hypothetical protein
MMDPPSTAAATPLAAALQSAAPNSTSAHTDNHDFIGSLLGGAGTQGGTTILAPVPFNLPPLNNNGIVTERIDVSMIAAPAAAAATAPVATQVTAAPTAQARGPEIKCDVRGCKLGRAQPPPEMVQCDAIDCSKMVHRLCYVHIVCKNRNANDEHSFCTCFHHDSFTKSMSDANLSWTNDGANGRDDPETSQFFLIRWLGTGENYNLYRKPTGGRTKIDIAREISQYINSKGVREKRTAEMAQAKITWVQGLMRETYDFTVTPTGTGIKEREGFDSFKEKVCCCLSIYRLFSALTKCSSKHRC